MHTTKKDESEANLEFVAVVSPKGWSKSGVSKIMPVKLQCVRRPRFFNALVGDLRKKGFEADDYAPPPLVHHHTFKSGVCDITYNVIFETDGNAWVYIPGWPKDIKPILAKLQDKKQAILEELDLDSHTSINWRVPSTGTLGVYRKATLYDSEEELEKIRKWMYEYLIRFREVFTPRMEKIIAELENSDK